MRGVVHDRRLELDRPTLEVLAHLRDAGEIPKTVLRHELVKLLQLSQARHVASPVSQFRVGECELAGAGVGRVVRQFLEDELRFRGSAQEREPHEGLEHREEALGRSTRKAGGHMARS